MKHLNKARFEVNHWILNQRANWLAYKAEQAIAEYKRKRGLKR